VVREGVIYFLKEYFLPRAPSHLVTYFLMSWWTSSKLMYEGGGEDRAKSADKVAQCW